nr:hypothetical protein [Tanacetum cinerariifolium]
MFGESDSGGGELGVEAEKRCVLYKIGDLGVLSIKDEEVPLVDGVFEGALGALEALKIEALVDAMEVYGG